MSQSDNRRLTPEILTNELGWTFVNNVPYDNVHPMALFKKEYDEPNCMDCFSYLWTLYVPPFNYFGTWQGAEFIIEQERCGGFFGLKDKHAIFHGYLATVEDYKEVARLTRIK